MEVTEVVKAVIEADLVRQVVVILGGALAVAAFALYVVLVALRGGRKS